MGTVPYAMAGPCIIPSLKVLYTSCCCHVTNPTIPFNKPCWNLPEIKFWNIQELGYEGQTKIIQLKLPEIALIDQFKKSCFPVLFIWWTPKLSVIKKLHRP